MDKRKAFYLVFTVLFLSFFSCKQDGGSEGPNPNKQAKSFCDCTQPAVTISNKLASISPDEREGLIKESQQALKEALNCLSSHGAAQKLIAPDKIKAWEVKYRAAVKKKCPDAVKVLNLDF